MFQISQSKQNIISSHNWFPNHQFVCLFLGWFHPFMSCSSVQNKIFHSRGFEASTISFFTWKRAQEKIFFFSPIIFLLLSTFTKYNFKMPTSEHFFFSIFFPPLIKHFHRRFFSSERFLSLASFSMINVNWLIWDSNEHFFLLSPLIYDKSDRHYDIINFNGRIDHLNFFSRASRGDGSIKLPFLLNGWTLTELLRRLLSRNSFPRKWNT